MLYLDKRKHPPNFASKTGVSKKKLKTMITSTSTKKQLTKRKRHDVVIVASMVDKLPASQKLYWYCRMIDSDGSGKVTISANEVAIALGKDRSTISRWLQNCTRPVGRSQMFTSVIKSHGSCTLYYTSLVKLAIGLGLTKEDFGAIGRISLKELGRLSYAATEIQTDWLQKKAHYAHAKEIEEQARKDEKRPWVDRITSIFEGKSFDYAHEGKRTTKDERYYLVSSNFTFNGVPQSHIAKTLGVSTRTVQRRLSNTQRSRFGYPEVRKYQLARRQALTTENWEKLAISCGEMESANEFRRLFNWKGRVYKAEQNVYWLPVELVRKKGLRREFAIQCKANLNHAINSESSIEWSDMANGESDLSSDRSNAIALNGQVGSVGDRISTNAIDKEAIAFGPYLNSTIPTQQSDALPING